MTGKYLNLTIVFLSVVLTMVFVCIFVVLKSEVPAVRQVSENVESNEVINESVKPKAYSIRVPILMYHHVGTLLENANALDQDLTVIPEDLEMQLAWLKQEGFESVSLEQVYKAVNKETSLPPKPVVFTFDDGYEDVFRNALPILEKYEFKGSFAIITSLVGHPGYASWNDIKYAREKGMEIVSHTTNHFDGSSIKYNAEYIYGNLVESRRDLVENIGETSRILIYPYGHYTAGYLREARRAGFVMALTTAYGTEVRTDKLMEVPRLRVHGEQDFERFKKNVLAK